MNDIPKSCEECEFVSIDNERGTYYCNKLYRYLDRWKSETERDYFCPIEPEEVSEE